VSTNPEKVLEESLATLPALMQSFLQYDWSCLNDPSFSQKEVLEFCKWLQDKEPAVRQEYERILKRNRAKWNEYCRRAKQIEESTAPLFRTAPKGQPGAPRKEREAKEYAALHPSKSYRQIAKEELKEELQAVPDDEAKKLLIHKEGERIRGLVRRSRRRKNT